MCVGLEMAWVLRPPEKVLSGEEFTVIYSVTVRDEFYQWAVNNDIFIHRSVSHTTSLFVSVCMRENEMCVHVRINQVHHRPG